MPTPVTLSCVNGLILTMMIVNMFRPSSMLKSRLVPVLLPVANITDRRDGIAPTEISLRPGGTIAMDHPDGIIAVAMDHPPDGITTTTTTI